MLSKEELYNESQDDIAVDGTEGKQDTQHTLLTATTLVCDPFHPSQDEWQTTLIFSNSPDSQNTIVVGVGDSQKTLVPDNNDSQKTLVLEDDDSQRTLKPF